MQGILKTPLYKNTAYCPHLVEHCTFSGYGSEQRFFGFTLPYSNVETRIGKTIFWLDKNQSIEKLKSEIQLPLDKTVISKENKILKQELDKRKRKDDFLFERIGRVVYKDNWIPSRKAEKLSQQELLRYHKQWYQNPMIWVVDSEKENNVVQRPL
ncbi:MAG: hypothetical protein LBU27_07825 [Candidatus Peribacteria bacterium]|jgi:hypothetical protein|nr:hypothetical protein [Candidatus Peribacteria bacterium]